MATEAKDLVRRAIGDAAGLTIKAQIRRATANLGYGDDAWRIREALYGRAGSWSAAALDDLRRRFAAWRQHEIAAHSGAENEHGKPALAQRLDAVRRGLTELQRQVDELAAEIVAVDGAPR